jgi:2-methylisocitrate lyase-like PEP mutase family enzyme
MLFLEAPHSRDELETIARKLADLDVPLMVNLVEGGKTPLLSVPELSAMGYQLIAAFDTVQNSLVWYTRTR